MSILTMYPWLKKQYLQWQQQLNRLSHAYLLAGVDGIGLTDFAQQMSKDILCKKTGLLACNDCSACNLFSKNNHPDFFHLTTLENKKEISIDQVRELNKKLFATSHQGGYKVALIELAEKLNISSFNALLKTLEEPPAQTIIILTSYQKGRIPATILSRCRKIDFTTPTLIDSINWLQQNLPQADQALLKKSLRVNWLAPLNAKQWIETKQFIQEKDWQDGLKSLLESRSSVAQLVAKWLKYETPEVVFDYFYLWSIARVRAAQYQRRIEFNPNWFVFQKMILQARSIWQQNANKELLLEAVCLAWQQHQLPNFNPQSNLFIILKGNFIRGTNI